MATTSENDMRRRSDQRRRLDLSFVMSRSENRIKRAPHRTNCTSPMLRRRVRASRIATQGAEARL